MPIITVATSKGGAGKTTIARLLLGHAAQYGRSVAALDADANHSLANWAARASKVPITTRAERDENKVVPIVRELSEAHDFLLIDTPGAEARATVFAIGCADLVLVPVKLSDADVLEGIKTMQLIASTETMLGRKVAARIVLTAYRPRTTVAGVVERLLADAKLPVLRTRLHDLIAFSDMTFTGVVPQSGAAGLQVAELFDEVMELTGEAQTPATRKAS